MLQAFFNGLSGLLAFSKGLDNVSNNVSNMNTPAYRGSDTFFRSVNGQDGQGLGAGITGTQVRTKAGDTRQTGNDTNAAITGAGYFVLHDSNQQLFYSRAGQFQIDKDGYGGLRQPVPRAGCGCLGQAWRHQYQRASGPAANSYHQSRDDRHAGPQR